MNNAAPWRRQVARFGWSWLGIISLAWLASFTVSDGALLGFQRAVPGYMLTFPVDHAAHPDYRTEWWYYTGHLRPPPGSATAMNSRSSATGSIAMVLPSTRRNGLRITSTWRTWRLRTKP